MAAMDLSSIIGPMKGSMTVDDYIYIVVAIIRPESEDPDGPTLICDACDGEAWAQGVRAPLIPNDYPTICPEYNGKCLRCKGDLHIGGYYLAFDLRSVPFRPFFYCNFMIN